MLGWFPLHYAAQHGHIIVIQLLLEAGRDVNAPAAIFYGRTALQAASEGGYEDVVKLLLSHSADVNTPVAEFSGRTALQAALESDYKYVVQLLSQVDWGHLIWVVQGALF